jgi:uncharacterized protein
MSTPSTQQRTAPSFEITVGGTVLSHDQTQGVQSLVIEDHVDMVSMLTLELGGAEGQPAWATYEIGKEIKAKIGGNTSFIFKGDITALEPSWGGAGGTRIVIRALDPLHRLARGRQSKVFEEVKDSDVVSQVASDAGLSVQTDATSEKHKYILQRNESNLVFLKRLAARNNFHLRLDRDSLVFKKNEFAGEEIELTLGQNVESLRISANTADLADKVVVLGWDPGAKAKVDGTASSVNAVGGGTTGIALANSKFGGHTAFVTDVPVTTSSLAQDIATAELERIARQFIRGTGTIGGDDRVRAGACIKLTGFGAIWDGKYLVMASRHVVGAGSAYKTEFTFCSNSFGGQAS